GFDILLGGEGREGWDCGDATAVIAQITGCEESESEFRRVSGIRILVDLLDGGTGSSDRIKENAVGVLLNLARTGGEKVREEVKGLATTVVEGIKDVLEIGSSKGKSKAMALLVLIEGGSLRGNEQFYSMLNHHYSS
ncbi:hypothetical protein LINGRAHAP2_LOCUS7425, partial [Linum grandiflorum]